VNEEIDHQTDINVHHYKGTSRTEILERIQMLDKEWDIERVLEVNASTLALSGLILGLTKKSKMVLPARHYFAVSLTTWTTRMVPSLIPIASAWYPYSGRNRPGKICA
jgi:hypothetical protein